MFSFVSLIFGGFPVILSLLIQHNVLVRLATAMLTLMGGFCHPQLMIQLRHIALLDLGPHLEQLLRRWMTVHGSSVSPGVGKASRIIMKAHEFFVSKSADFSLAHEEEQYLSPYAIRMSHE